jgi:hypothetical protein
LVGGYWLGIINGYDEYSNLKSKRRNKRYTLFRAFKKKSNPMADYINQELTQRIASHLKVFAQQKNYVNWKNRLQNGLFANYTYNKRLLSRPHK